MSLSQIALIEKITETIKLPDEELPPLNYTFKINTDELLENIIRHGRDFIDVVKKSYINSCLLRLSAFEPEKVKKRYSNLKIVFELPKKTKMTEITHDLENIPIMFDCVIMFVDEPKAYVKTSTVRCPKHDDETNNINFDPIKDTRSQLPLCGKCNTRMAMVGDTMRNAAIQTLLLEEFPEDAVKNTTVKFAGKLRDNFVGETYIGQRKRIVGIFRTINDDNEKKENPVVIDIMSIQDLEERNKTMLYEDDIKSLTEKSKTPEWKKFLLDSFAPHIKNRDLEKQAVLLSLLSGTEGLDLRSRSHVLLCGPAGSGKSEIGKYAKLLLEKGDLVDGTAMSRAGLVFGLDKTTFGTNIPRAGPVVVNNGGAIIIDEFDKCGKTERSALHRVLEQGEALFTKIGYNIKMPASITMIALSNPQYLEWKEGMTTMDNLKPIEKTILDRCDVIIRVFHTKEISKRKEQLRSFAKSQSNVQETLDIMSPDIYRGLINHMKHIEPKLLKEAEDMIVDFYGDMISIEQPEGSLPMEQRQGEALFRLCVSMARFYLKNEITCDIAGEVIEFYKSTLKTLSMNIEKGITQINLEDSHMNKDERFWKCVEDITKDDLGFFHEADLINVLLESKSVFFNTEEKIAKYIYEAHEKQGRLLKQRGKFRKT